MKRWMSSQPSSFSKKHQAPGGLTLSKSEIKKNGSTDGRESEAKMDKHSTEGIVYNLLNPSVSELEEAEYQEFVTVSISSSELALTQFI
jgi:hypothetical protein